MRTRTTKETHSHQPQPLRSQAATMTEQIADLRGNQEEISHAGRIPQTAFIVSRQLHRATIPTPPYHKLHNANTCCCSLHASISVLFGLVVVATLTRFITRLVSRGRLYLDDFFVLFALVFINLLRLDTSSAELGLIASKDEISASLILIIFRYCNLGFKQFLIRT